ncbi:MAG: hypothetical protein ACOYKJ_06225 [Candidatus Howiella sp.]|jgi:hypothetical protein
MQDIASGAFDYNTVLRRTVKEMGIPQQRERVTVDGLGNIGVGKWKKTVEKCGWNAYNRGEIYKYKRIAPQHYSTHF